MSITDEDFEKVEIRTGVITAVEDFPRARNLPTGSRSISGRESERSA